MSGLETRYQGQVDFVHIDWDDPDSRPVLAHFGVIRRTTYIVLDPVGNQLWQWIGPLDGESVAAELDRALSNPP